MPSEGTLKKKQKYLTVSSALANIGSALALPGEPTERLSKGIVEQNRPIAQSIAQQLEQKRLEKKRRSSFMGKILGIAGSVAVPALAPVLGPIGGAVGGMVGSAVGQGLGGGGVDPVNVLGSGLQGGLGAVSGSKILADQAGVFDAATGKKYAGASPVPLVPKEDAIASGSGYYYQKPDVLQRLFAYMQGLNAISGGPYFGMIPADMFSGNPYLLQQQLLEEQKKQQGAI